MSENRVVVVGAGIIGLASAYHLLKAGAAVTVIDRDPHGDCTSTGNAGGIAVTEVIPAAVPGIWWRALAWMRDPLGPLSIRPRHAPQLIPWLIRFARSSNPTEAARIALNLTSLNARVYEDLLPMLENIGLATHLHRAGALHVYESELGYRRDAPAWAQRRSLGIVTETLTAADARNMEPALGPLACRAVFTPQWSHISNPKQLVTGLRQWLQLHGVTFQRGEVCDLSTTSSSSVTLHGTEGEKLSANRAIIAAGAWSAILARRIGDRVLLESERGYNTTLPRPNVTIERQLIFPERKFVATQLNCGLRIGGAVEFGGLKASANFNRSRSLVDLALRYLPKLETKDGTVWAGHRPATPDSLPVIGPSRRKPGILYAFGHGHLGLTQAATTGRLIADLIFHRPPVIDLAPYAIDRFE